MSSDVIEQFTTLERPSIKKIKEEILKRALERHRRIERGECDVPMHYVPLPVATLYDLLGQLEYRADSLSLAVPPMKPGFGARCKRWIKQLLCKAQRWIFIRQVEFNTVAVEFSREISEQLASADRNLGEFIASVSALKLQVHGLNERLRRLESGNPESSSSPREEEGQDSPELEQHFYQSLLPFLKNRGPVVLANLGQIDLLKLLISEGISAKGTETNPELIEAALERDLPIEQCEPAAYLKRCGQDNLDVVFLGSSCCQESARRFAELLALAWQKLRQGGLIMIAADNPASNRRRTPPELGGRRPVPVEMLTYVLESQCFWVADILFWQPVSEGLKPVAQSSQCWTYDLKHHGKYMVVGVKS